MLQFAIFPSVSLADTMLSLDADGQQIGAFARLSQTKDDPQNVTLEEGWVSEAFLALWGPTHRVGDRPLPRGRYEFSGDCEGRRLELIQALDGGQRARARSWTLMGACPMWAEIKQHDGEKIMMHRLVFTVEGIAAAR